MSDHRDFKAKKSRIANDVIVTRVWRLAYAAGKRRPLDAGEDPT